MESIDSLNISLLDPVATDDAVADIAWAGVVNIITTGTCFGSE